MYFPAMNLAPEKQPIISIQLLRPKVGWTYKASEGHYSTVPTTFT